MTAHKRQTQCFALTRFYQKQCNCISLDFDETLRDDFFPLLLLDSGEVTKHFQKIILAVNQNYYPPKQSYRTILQRQVNVIKLKSRAAGDFSRNPRNSILTPNQTCKSVIVSSANLAQVYNL